MTLSKEQIIKNHEKLIEVMEGLPEGKHVQSTWGMINKESPEQDNMCGTTACALGWAAVSGAIDGLGVRTIFARDSQTVGAYAPTIDGEAAFWPEAGKHFFGRYTHGAIFALPSGSRGEIVRRLKQRLDYLKNGGEP